MNFTLSASSNLPPGATVKVFARSLFPSVPLVPQGAPPGSGEVFSGTMGASSLTATGLSADTNYVAYAQVGSDHRYTQFRSGSLEEADTVNADLVERRLMRRSGVVWTTSSRNRNNNNATVLVTGKEHLLLAYLPEGLATTGMAFVSAGSAPSTTPTHLWFSLRDSSRNLLKYTADSQEQWTAGAHGLAWSDASTYIIPASALYYLGIAIVQGSGTLPSVVGTQVSATLSGLAPIVCGATSDTITGATPPSTAGTITASTQLPYVELLG